jgi:bla regulator protein BlaR1
METLVGWALPNAVIATALGLLAAAVQMRWKRPALAHALWVLVLLKLITPPLWRVPMAWAVAGAGDIGPGDPGREISAFVSDRGPEDPGAFEYFFVAEGEEIPGEFAAEAPAPAASEPFPWERVAFAAWLAGVGLWGGVIARHTLALWALLRRGRPADKATETRTDHWAEAMGLRRVPEVVSVEGAVSPMLWALGGRARLILPRELWVDLTCEQRDALLIHELAHYKRRDHWVRLLELVATGAFWWLPTVWWARRRLRAAEEQCCDAWVTSVLEGSERAYATALLDTLDFLARSPRADAPLLTASGMGQFHDLQGRISMILQGKSPRALSGLGRASVLGLSLAMLPAGLTFAQSEPADETKEEQVELNVQFDNFVELQLDETKDLDQDIEFTFTDPGMLEGKLAEAKEFQGVRILNDKIALIKVDGQEGDGEKKEGDKEKGDKGKDEPKLSPEQIKEKEAQIREAREELKQAQAQLRKAAERLGKLESELGRKRVILFRSEAKGPDGHGPVFRGGGGEFRVVRPKEGEGGRIIVAPRPPKPPHPPEAARIEEHRKRIDEARAKEDEVRRKGEEARDRVEGKEREDRFRSVPIRVRQLPEQDQRIRELEQKLDRVLKQLDEIKEKKGDGGEKEKGGKESTSLLPSSVFSYAFGSTY